MRNKESTLFILWMATWLLLSLVACDGATISDSIRVSPVEKIQPESAGSPLMIGSYQRKGVDGSLPKVDMLHCPVLYRCIRLDLVLDAEEPRFIIDMADKLITIGSASLLISLGIWLLSRGSGRTKNNKEPSDV